MSMHLISRGRGVQTYHGAEAAGSQGLSGCSAARRGNCTAECMNMLRGGTAAAVPFLQEVHRAARVEEIL